VPDDPNMPGESAPLPYFPAPTPATWVVIATFPSVGQWHSAKAALSRHGIEAQMSSISDDGSVQLLVFPTEAEWARDLIAGVKTQSENQYQTRGFPIIQPSVAPTANPSPQPRPFDQPPPLPRPKSPVPVLETDYVRTFNRQSPRYTVALTILWVLFVVMCLVTIWGVLVF
jgi:hypothetical protein